MPDVTLTPVSGDPWNGGAVDLHSDVAPPVRLTLSDLAPSQPAPAINTDPNALHRWDELTVSSLSAAPSQDKGAVAAPVPGAPLSPDGHHDLALLYQHGRFYRVTHHG